MECTQHFERNPWADLVFHVLAHVPSSTPASLYDAHYVAFSENSLGPARSRLLGADAEALSRLAQDFPKYAALQKLAWLFESPSQAARSATRELCDLGPADVADPALLSELAAWRGPELELLRCAVELERPFFERLPPSEIDAEAYRRAFATVAPAAPHLGSHRVCAIRALQWRGRVRAQELWIGAPLSAGQPPESHFAWQAAHEASVSELCQAAPSLAASAERLIEHGAIVLLAERARRSGLVREHAEWLSRLSAPSTDADSLTEPVRSLVLGILT